MESVQGYGLREGGTLIVLANGCFDPFHYGHLKHLQAARALGDVLVVSVTDDEHVGKGPGRPLFPLKERMELIRALAIVDEVIATPNAVEAIRKVKPAVYVKGREYESNLPEKQLVEFYGGRVVFTDGPTYSSTELVTGRHLELQSLVDRGRNS